MKRSNAFRLKAMMALCLLTFGLSTVSMTAGAQSGDKAADAGTTTGTVNAMIFHKLPKGSTLTVRALNDSETSISLKTLLEDAIARSGYGIAEKSSLVLSFETRNQVGAYSNSGRRSVLELEGHGGRMGGEDAKVRLNLFNSARGGVFNRGQGETNIVTQGLYRLDVTLDDRNGGKRLWQAWIESDVGSYREDELLDAMVPVIAQNIGKTVRRAPFKMR